MSRAPAAARAVPLAVGLALVLALGLVTSCGGADRAGASSGGDRELVVLAASSLTDALTDVAALLEEREGVEVVLSFAGSSQLVQQVRAGAPADLLVTASEATMQQAVDAGLVSGEPRVVATNALAVAVPAGDPGGVEGLADLAREELRVALCAPQVPCGAAAERALEAAGVAAAPDTLEPDVRAVLAKVRLGEVDAGVVYRTDVLAAGDAVEGLAVPGAERAATYPAAVVEGAAEPDLARALVDLLLEGEGADVLRQQGFGPP